MRGILFIALVAICTGYTTKPVKLFWSPQYRLQTSDFVTVNSYENEDKARIHTGIELYRETMGYRVYAYMDRKKSSMLSKVKMGYRLEDILRHEQGHFNISEYMARRANAELKYVANRFEAEKIYDRYVDSVLLMQRVYDGQTNQNNDPEWQEKWDKKLFVLLKDPNILIDTWRMYPYTNNQ